MEPRVRASPTALAVLSLLRVGPLHPYGMQRLIKQWGKDQVINVGQRANLYKTIRRLHDGGLIAVRQTERDQQYPERTVYELTERGEQQGISWVTEMLAARRNEFPEFPAALSFAMLLDPGQVRDALEQRAAALRQERARTEAGLRANGAVLPRITLLEDEYQRAMVAAEASWLAGVLDELQAGTLTWREADLAGQARSYLTE